jgi:uncharacterized protein
MMIKQRIDQDLKSAMLSGDKTLTATLRGIKSAILNVEINEGKREAGLSDDEVAAILSKEAKKRQESAELYQKGGSEERALAEIEEKAIIQRYLPEQLSDEELSAIIDEAVNQTGATGMQDMGKVIAKVKESAGSKADGGRIAATVKDRLQK